MYKNVKINLMDYKKTTQNSINNYVEKYLKQKQNQNLHIGQTIEIDPNTKNNKNLVIGVFIFLSISSVSCIFIHYLRKRIK